MVLVFGGTTEGRKAAEVLEEAGKVYYYSTKTGEQDITLHHGQRIDGALDGEAMQAFCREHGIRLIVDAAHPFAQVLHETIAKVSEMLHIPVVRYERIYPPRDPSIAWIEDYTQVPRNIHTLLATTGVQSISRLKPLEAQGVKVVYRILNRESSIQLAHQQGATDEQLCFYPQTVEAEAVLMKESGESGGFNEKIAEAKERGMRIIVLKRPELVFKHCVTGPYGLRRAVEHLMPDFFPLKTGLTTGACATAAVKAALLSLLYEEQPEEVSFALPDKEVMTIGVHIVGRGTASVVKDHSDDPDVTRGCTITASVRLTDTSDIRFLQGKGVGVVTLPGLGIPVGEPAINPTPREMITTTIRELTDRGCDVTISVEHGEELAKKTFNAKVGVVGGISIIGTSGIVSPLSNEAFIESIRREMEVARAIGCKEIGLVSGKNGEDALRKDSDIRCVHYGNAIGEALKIAADLQFKKVTVAIMIGKAVKLAEGHLDTHSHKATMNREFLKQIAGPDADKIDRITLARELWGIMQPSFFTKIEQLCYKHCRREFPRGELTIRLICDKQPS